MERRIMAALCAAGMSLALWAPALAAGTEYCDVEPGDWFYEAVETVTEQGLMGSVGGDAFDPDAPVSRAMVATLLWRLEGSPDTEGENPYTDVAEGQWYTQAVLWAAQTEVATGYDGAFRPDEPVSREMLAVFFYKYALYRDEPVAEGVLSRFSDGETISPWARAGVAHAVGMGLFTGSDGALDPGGITTRAELATVISRHQRPASG